MTLRKNAERQGHREAETIQRVAQNYKCRQRHRKTIQKWAQRDRDNTGSQRHTLTIQRATKRKRQRRYKMAQREREMAKIKKSIVTEKDRHTTARDGTKRKTF